MPSSTCYLLRRPRLYALLLYLGIISIMLAAADADDRAVAAAAPSSSPPNATASTTAATSTGGSAATPAATSAAWCPVAQALWFPHTPPGALLPTLLSSSSTLHVARRLSLAVARGVQSLLIAVPEAAVFRAGAPILQLRVWQQWQQLLRSKTKRTLADPATYAVTHKSAPAPGSDSKHDYYSLAPYWWPVGPRQNPDTASGLPYVRRDGAVNPEGHAIPDQHEFNALVHDVGVLALAWAFLGDSDAATRAVLLLSIWYLEPATRMTPRLEHAQVRKGVDGNAGSYTGLLELQRHVELLDSVVLLSDSPAASPTFMRGLRGWFSAYLDWLLSPSSIMDAWSASQGNHASWGAFQIAGVAAFVGRTDVVAQQVERLLLKLPQQIDANGSQPLEEERADSWHYCNYNLQALVQLATLTQNWVNWLSYNQSQSAVSASNSTPPSTLPDLFQCVSSTGGSSSILGGINALLPYVARQGGVDVNLWRATHLQRAAIDANDIVINLQFLSATYDHPLYQRPADRGAPVERFGAGLNYSYDYNAVAEAIQPTVLSSAADLAWVRRVPATWLKSAAEIRTVMDALVNATAAADAWSGSSSTAGAAPSPLVKLARASSTGRAGGLESDLANASPPIHPPTSSILLATLLALVSIVLALQHAF